MLFYPSPEKMSHPSPDGSKKVKQEYEKKLGNLQEELKKLQADQRKHAKIQKNNSQYERHLKTLQHEIVEMKKTKVFIHCLSYDVLKLESSLFYSRK